MHLDEIPQAIRDMCRENNIHVFNDGVHYSEFLVYDEIYHTFYNILNISDIKDLEERLKEIIVRRNLGIKNDTYSESHPKTTKETKPE